MPLLRHAKKKLRQDKKRTSRNRRVKTTYKELIKKAATEKTTQSLSLAFSAIDKAEKHNLLHKNKAARMKSSLSKISEGKTTLVTTKAAKPKSKAAKLLAKKKTSTKKTAKKHN